ncbi:hypothetical protein XENOCAPTIV_018245, partial [Xenoophorus captivus]
GIFRVLGLMKTDMVNFAIQSLRPHLLQQAVAASEEALALQAQCDSPGPDSRALPSATAILNRAYMRLLRWDPQDQKYPETMQMDRSRLDALSQQLQILVLEASVLLLTGTQCQGVIFSLQGFVGKLKQTITALLEGSHTREADLKRALLELGEAVLQQVKEALSIQGGGELPQESQDLLRGQISELWKNNNSVQTLIGQAGFQKELFSRHLLAHSGFLLAMLQGGSAKRRPELHFPLRLVSPELAELGTAFGRIVHFNRTVYGPFYAPFLRKMLLPSGESETGEDSR